MYFSKELYTILLTIESPLSKMSKIKVLNKAELMLQILHIHCIKHFMMQCLNSGRNRLYCEILIACSVSHWKTKLPTGIKAVISIKLIL